VKHSSQNELEQFLQYRSVVQSVPQILQRGGATGREALEVLKADICGREIDIGIGGVSEAGGGCDDTLFVVALTTFDERVTVVVSVSPVAEGAGEPENEEVDAEGGMM
jgi:hypothetical protein